MGDFGVVSVVDWELLVEGVFGRGRVNIGRAVVFETMVVRTHSGDWAKGVVRLRIWSWERRTMLLGSWWWCA